RNRKANTLTISQTGYVNEDCKRFGVQGGPERTPYAPSQRLDRHEEDKACPGGVPYREAVGNLVWAALMTRIDIKSPVREVAMYCEEPKIVHWRVVLSILRWLCSFLERGVCFGGPGACCYMSAYADAGHGPYIEDRRSVTGVVVVFYGGTISWMPRTQKIV
ncbi:unnamed protein product, partial [Discosporangium mesarthrocarpum]